MLLVVSSIDIPDPAVTISEVILSRNQLCVSYSMCDFCGAEYCWAGSVHGSSESAGLY